MRFDKRTLWPALLSLGVTAWPCASIAQEGITIGGTYLGVFRTTVGAPTYRDPQGYSRVSAAQDINTLGFSVGYKLLNETGGVVIGLSYRNIATAPFRVPTASDRNGYVIYNIASISYMFIDIAVQVRLGQTPFSIYEVYGIGYRSEQFIVAGSDISSRNGPMNNSGLSFSSGLGLRADLIDFFSIFAEMRWLPETRRGPRFLTFGLEFWWP